MTMNIKELFDDDSAVSPVIGVILMVAITVILAAVIASFVLGLGDSQNVTPTASISTDYSAANSDSGLLTVRHDSGDTIRATEVYVRGNPGDGDHADLDASPNYNHHWKDFVDVNTGDMPATGSVDGSVSGDISGDSAVVAGDYIELPVDSDGELNIVYEAEEGDSTATLASWSGPDA